MTPLTEKSVFAIADDLVRKLSNGEPHRLLVRNSQGAGQHRLIEIWWDSLVEREDRRFASRATAVDIADTEEMVRYRVRAMFANDDHLEYVGRYQTRQICVMDHPDEPPPYEIEPT